MDSLLRTTASILSSVSVSEVSLFDVLFHRGKQSLIAKNYDSAIKFLSEALEHSPDHDYTHYYLGLTYLQKQSTLMEAEVHFSSLLSNTKTSLSTDPSVFIFSAVGLRKQSKLSCAVRRLSGLLRLVPRHSDALILRGEIYLQLSQPNKALSDFSGALINSIDISPALSGLAMCNYLLNSFKEAQKLINLAQNYCRDQSELIRFRSGLINLKLLNLEEAENDFTKSIELNVTRTKLINSTIAEPLIFRASIYFKKNSPELALKDLQNAELLAPNDARIYKEKGKINFDLGNYFEAYSDYKKLNLIEPNQDSRYLLILLEVLINLQQFYNSKKVLIPKNLHQILGISLQKTSKEAIPIEHYLIKGVRGFCHGGRGDSDAACIEFQSALEILEAKFSELTAVQNEVANSIKNSIKFNHLILSIVSLIKKGFYLKANNLLKTINSKQLNFKSQTDVNFLLSITFDRLNDRKSALAWGFRAFKLISNNNLLINYKNSIIVLFFYSLLLCDVDRVQDATEVLTFVIENFSQFSNSESEIFAEVFNNCRLLRCLCLTQDSLSSTDLSLAEKARIDIEIILGQEKASDNVHAIYAKVLYALGSHSKSLSLHRTYCSSLELASLYWSLGDTSLALKCFYESAVTMQKKSKVERNSILIGHLKLCICLLKFEEIELLIENLHKGASKLDHGFQFDVKCFKLIELINSGSINFDRITSSLSSILELESEGIFFKKSWVYSVLALINWKLGNIEESKNLFKNLASISDLSPSMLFNLALFSIFDGNFSLALDCLTQITRQTLKFSSLHSLPEPKNSPSNIYLLELLRFIIESVVCNRFNAENDISLVNAVGIDKGMDFSSLNEDEIEAMFLDYNGQEKSSDNEMEVKMPTLMDLDFLEKNVVTLCGNAPIKVSNFEILITKNIGIRNFSMKSVFPLPCISPAPVIDISLYFPVSCLRVSDYLVDLIPPWLKNFE
ncbi:hypothetical protein RCL1_002387 [Eukaryota sp. TZLM3-RCL]